MEVVTLALTIYFVLRNLNFTMFEVQPGLSGEVSISCERQNKVIEVILNEHSRHEFYLEENGVDVKKITDLDLQGLLRELTRLNEWPLSDYLTHSITTQPENDIIDWYSSDQTATWEYRLSA